MKLSITERMKSLKEHGGEIEEMQMPEKSLRKWSGCDRLLKGGLLNKENEFLSL